MAYYDGEILTPADSEKNSARDLALQIPPKVYICKTNLNTGSVKLVVK